MSTYRTEHRGARSSGQHRAPRAMRYRAELYVIAAGAGAVIAAVMSR